jgi:hypothetical protein
MGAAALHSGAEQAALAHHLQERHAVRVVHRAQQVVDQAGDEHRLAGTGQTGHRQPDGRAGGEVDERRRELSGRGTDAGQQVGSPRWTPDM